MRRDALRCCVSCARQEERGNSECRIKNYEFGRSLQKQAPPGCFADCFLCRLRRGLDTAFGRRHDVGIVPYAGCGVSVSVGSVGTGRSSRRERSPDRSVAQWDDTKTQKRRVRCGTGGRFYNRPYGCEPCVVCTNASPVQGEVARAASRRGCKFSLTECFHN